MRRYDAVVEGMIPSPDGDWVRYEDIEKEYVVNKQKINTVSIGGNIETPKQSKVESIRNSVQSLCIGIEMLSDLTSEISSTISVPKETTIDVQEFTLSLLLIELPKMIDGETQKLYRITEDLRSMLI